MFSECYSLSSLPDVSLWNTKNVTNMREVFSKCLSLYYLPDISKWNFNNVNNMGHIFYGSLSISIIPDILNWNINKPDGLGLNAKTNIDDIFVDCINIIKIPKIKEKDL